MCLDRFHSTVKEGVGALSFKSARSLETVILEDTLTMLQDSPPHDQRFRHTVFLTFSHTTGIHIFLCQILQTLILLVHRIVALEEQL